MCRAFGSSLLQEAERSSSIHVKKEVQQKKSFQETSQEGALITLHPPSTCLSPPQRMKLRRPHMPRENTLTPHRSLSPGMNQLQWTRMKLEKWTAQDTPLHHRQWDTSIKQRHTALSNKLDKALQEALEKPSPRASSLKKQGSGDREPTPGPQDLHQGELNLTTERWWLEPNKVRFMDEPDTYRANVGRHREHQPRLMRAKTYPHLVFADPPASPDKAAPGRKELQAAPQGRPQRPPQTPQQTRENLV